jgi:hypothetical protein
MGDLRWCCRIIAAQIAAITAVYPDFDISIVISGYTAYAARVIASRIYLDPRTMGLGLTVPVLIVLEPCHRISISEKAVINTSPIYPVTGRVAASPVSYTAVFINGHMVPISRRVVLAGIRVGIEFNSKAPVRQPAVPHERAKLLAVYGKVSAYRRRIAVALDKGEREAVSKSSARTGINVLKPEVKNSPQGLTVQR